MSLKHIFSAFLVIISLFLFSCEKTDDEPPMPDGNWNFLGLENIRVEKIKYSENFIYAATFDGIYRNNLNNIIPGGWENIGLESREVLDIIVFNDQEMIAAAQLNPDEDVSLFRTTDGGNNWLPYQHNFGGEDPSTVLAVTYNPSNPNILFARGAYVVAKSTDRGQSWQPVFGDWDGAGYQAPLIKMDQNHPEYVWAGGENAIFQPYLIKSTDLGETWIPADPPYEGDNAVYTLVAHPENPERILIGMEGQILSSADGGQNWNTSITFEDGTYIISMKQHPNQQETIYATGSQGGTSGGNLFFYQSNDFGQTWQFNEYEEDPGPYFVNDIEVLVNGQEVNLYFATDKGVYGFING